MNGGPKFPPSCASCNKFMKDEDIGGLEYKRKKKGRETYSIAICRDCLDKPESINIEKVVKELEKWGYWKEENIRLVRKALKRFKKGKMKRVEEPDGSLSYVRK